MGDRSFYSILRRLASARTPLLSIHDLTDEVDIRSLTVTITQAGRDVIEGQEDGVALNGIDQWLGGVHLIGQHRSPWRWDGWLKRWYHEGGVRAQDSRSMRRPPRP